MNILVILIASTISVLLILLLISIRYDRLVKQAWQSLKIESTGLVFSQDMIADLDEPIQRYFLHAIDSGTPLASFVELEMNSSFRLQPNADWLPMQAKEIIAASSGFVWKANIGKDWFKFSGADYQNHGKGRTKFSFWGLIPLVDAQNNNINRSSIGRLAIEYIWLPSALLPQNGVAWQAISNNSLQANFNLNGEPITITFNIDSDGKLLRISLARWSDNTKDRNWEYIPFGAEVQTERTFGGYTIPGQIDVGYWFGTDKYWAFFKAAIKQSKFE